MLIWYKMMHKFSYGHNRSKIRAPHPKIIRKIYLQPNYANLVIKSNNSYTKCSMIAVVQGIILSIIGNFFEHCSKA